MKTTRDYDKFSFLNYNRSIDASLVKRLKESINSIGYIDGRPIIVTKDGKIIDGQHRYVVCKELGIPVPYVVQEINGKTEQKLVIELNRNQKPWGLQQYVESWASRGVPFYRAVLEFHDRHKLGFSNSMIICQGVHHNMPSKVRAGVNVPLNKNRERCAEFIQTCKGLPFYRSLKFVRSVCLLINRASTRQVNKLLKNHMSIPEQPNQRAYHTVFCNIINRGAKGTDRLYL